MSVVYPLEYTAEDKAVYDDLISRGRMMIGKKIKQKDDFLLDLAAKMTINQAKGYKNDLSMEDIFNQMHQHKEALKNVNISTPEDMYETGQHPLELNPAQPNEIEPPYAEESPAASNEKHPLDCNLIQ